ncbi:PD-(D/E)XK nuclease family protein [Brevibacillus choshinensis]|uniref:PD-(D/E)XK nuclease family protein n=1 Tax=Brevibacillus choshinensis TaxID=54911 RepID=UPI002E1D651D|nr:PD-(D/E)XK nuclease family protein [Brevibacillus choshinensis]
MLIDVAVKKMLVSPMYHLSLSSKELFHSNFLAWLFVNYKDESNILFKKYIDDTEGNYNISSVTREENNRDLTVYFQNSNGNSKKLIIENKVKSIPNYQQLSNYSSNALQNEYFLLVSLTEPSFFTDRYLKIGECVWHYLSYGDLAKVVKELSHQIRIKNPYHGEITLDYSNFISALQEVLSGFDVDNRINTYDFYDGNSMLSTLREIRLHDFFLKHQHAKIANQIHIKIKSNISEALLVPEKKWEDGKLNEVFVGSGYTNGSGISEVKYVVEMKNLTPVILGVQIQRDQFRLFLEAKEHAPQLAQLLFDEGMWFNFAHAKQVEGLGELEYPTNKHKIFNTYSGSFMYRAIKIKKCSMEKLLDSIVYYINYIHENRSKIKSIFTQI